VTPAELDRLIQDLAARSPAYATRLTPELLILKASLAADEARQIRSRRIEMGSLAVIGLLLIFGSTILPPSLPSLTLTFGAMGLGALALGLGGEYSFP